MKVRKYKKYSFKLILQYRRESIHDTISYLYAKICLSIYVFIRLSRYFIIYVNFFIKKYPNRKFKVSRKLLL